MLGNPRRCFVLGAVCLLAATNTVAQGWQHIGNVQRVTKLSDGVELLAGKTKVRVTAFRDGVFRVRVAPDGNFAKDSSWAVIDDGQAPRVQIEDAADAGKITAGNAIGR